MVRAARHSYSSKIRAKPFSQRVFPTDIAIGFAETSYTFLEGASNPSVVLRKDSGRISERTDIAVMVDLSGTFSATRGPDFEVALLSTRIDFAPNEQEETISLTIVDDNLPEGLESFRLTVTSVELGFGPRSDTFATTEVFITDNDGTCCVVNIVCSVSGDLDSD